MSRVRTKRPAPLVNVPVVFTREELAGVDFMARGLRLDRGGVVRRALDVLALVGPLSAYEYEVGEAVASICCTGCGARPEGGSGTIA